MSYVDAGYGWFIFAGGIVLAAAGQAHDSAELSGRVTNSGGRPVVVRLRSLEDNPLRYYEGYEEKTGSDGRFRFSQIKAGAYRVETATSGLRATAVTTVALKPGEKRGGIEVRVAPSFSLCGHVSLRGGEVRASLSIDAYRLVPGYGVLSRQYVEPAGGDGRFMWPDVEPGIYYIRDHLGLPVALAEPITVGEGMQRGCWVDVRYESGAYQATKVSGRIGGPGAHPNVRYKVQLLARNAHGGTLRESSGSDLYKPGDQFEVWSRPGSHDLVLTDEHDISPWENGNPTPKVVFDSKYIEVGGEAIEGVELKPQAMASISGEAPGMSHSVTCRYTGPRAQVSILRDGDGQYQSVELDDKNRFRFENVAPGEYSVYFGPVAREELYVDSVVVDGKRMTGRKFTVPEPKPMTMVINLSSDLLKVQGKLSPDWARKEAWEVGWTRPKGAVSGTVSSSGQGPVTVRLISIRHNSNTSREYVGAVTGGGRFHVDAVDPGVYTLRVEGPDLVTTEYGARGPVKRGVPVVVARGAHVSGLRVMAPRLGVVCGKVSKPDGTPFAGVSIQVLEYRSLMGEPRSAPEVRTDSDGRFRVEGVRPGKYFLASPLDLNRRMFQSSDGTLSTAKPLEVEAGAVVGCGTNADVTWRVAPDYRSRHKVNGKVAGKLPEGVGERFTLNLTDVNESGARHHVASSVMERDQLFTFTDVPTGRFRLELYGEEVLPGPRISLAPRIQLVATQAIEVRERMPEVAIVPRPSQPVTGRVRFESIPTALFPNFEISKQEIVFVDFTRRKPLKPLLQADGTFTIAGAEMVEYETIPWVAHPLYVRTVRLNGRELKERTFRLEHGTPAHLEVDIRGDVSNVAVEIVPDRKLPLAEPPLQIPCSKYGGPMDYQILLIPEPLFESTGDGRRPRMEALTTRRLEGGAAHDGKTHAELYGIAPGRYRAVAMQTRQLLTTPFGSAPRWRIQERHIPWLEALGPLGQVIEVPPGGTTNISLRDRTLEVLKAVSVAGAPLDAGLFDAYWR